MDGLTAAARRHAVWQGQIVSLSGRRGYLSLADIGYGSGDGFGGWNCRRPAEMASARLTEGCSGCRHDWFPFFEDVSERAYSDADLKKLNEPSVSYRDKMYTEYELSQMQRAMEREIRKQKRAVLAAKEGIDAAETDDVRASSRGQILARYTTHVRQNPNSRSGKQQLFTQESVKLKREERKLREFLQETGLQPENA